MPENNNAFCSYCKRRYFSNVCETLGCQNYQNSLNNARQLGYRGQEMTRKFSQPFYNQYAPIYHTDFSNYFDLYVSEYIGSIGKSVDSMATRHDTYWHNLTNLNRLTAPAVFNERDAKDFGTAFTYTNGIPTNEFQDIVATSFSGMESIDSLIKMIKNVRSFEINHPAADTLTLSTINNSATENFIHTDFKYLRLISHRSKYSLTSQTFKLALGSSLAYCGVNNFDFPS